MTGKAAGTSGGDIETIYASAKKLIGTETPVIRGRYPVEFEPVRRYCHMVDDGNPLFLDPEYGRQSRFGAVLCPSFLVNILGRESEAISPWPKRERPGLPVITTPGNRNINLAIEWEFLKPVRVGDWISCKDRIADIFIKPIKMDPQAFWIVIERLYYNQDGDLVAVLRNTMVRHRTLTAGP